MSPAKRLVFLVLTVAVVGGIWWSWKGTSQSSPSQGLSGGQTTREATPPETEGPKDLAAPEREVIAGVPKAEAASQNMEEVTPVSGMLVPSDKEFGPEDPWFQLRFQVVDVAGEPVRKTTLRMSYSYPVEKPDNEQTHTVPFEFQTDGEGRVDRPFAVSEESLRSVVLWLSDPASQRKARVLAPLVLRGVSDVGEISLLSPRDRYPVPLVTGTVRSDEGDLIPGVVAAISHRELSPGQTTWPDWGGNQIDIDEAGNFEAYGPPGSVTVVLHFFAPGFHDTDTPALPLPSSGVEVLMPERLVYTGKLLVPDHGPPVSSYGVWITQDHGAIGVSPGKEGHFKAQGTRRSLRLEIAHPGPGTVVYTREFLFAPGQGESLGVIDLRTAVMPVNFVVVDGEGNPRPNLHLIFAAKGYEFMVDQIFTDLEGRLFTVMPADVTHVRFGVQGGESKEVALSALTGEVTLAD